MGREDEIVGGEFDAYSPSELADLPMGVFGELVQNVEAERRRRLLECEKLKIKKVGAPRKKKAEASK